MRTTAVKQLLWIGAGLLLALPLSALQSRSERALDASRRQVASRPAVHDVGRPFDVCLADERTRWTKFTHPFDRVMFRNFSEVANGGNGEHLLGATIVSMMEPPTP